MSKKITLVLVVACLFFSLLCQADSLRSVKLPTYQHYNHVKQEKNSKVLTNQEHTRAMLAPAALKPASSKPVPFELNSRGELFLHKLPSFQTSIARNPAMHGIGTSGDIIQFTTIPVLQEHVQNLMRQVNAPHASIVVMNPRTGKILAFADKSSSLDKPLQHAGFPAASLFKVVTAAAAIEKSKLTSSSVIKFRGGNYQLDRTNYRPNPKRDRQSLTLGKAMGKSTNPVFSVVALKHLTPQILRHYSNTFGFNTDLQFDVPLRESSALIPNDAYEFGRTAAGFGKVFISPIHAAVFMSATANGGSILRPHIIEQVQSKSGTILYKSRASTVRTAISKNTAPLLVDMMTNSITSGTSRYAFYNRGKPILPVSVAGKTGTLRGKNPVGQNRWFIGTAPANNPEIVVVAHSINPRNSSSRPSAMASSVLQKYFREKK